MCVQHLFKTLFSIWGLIYSCDREGNGTPTPVLLPGKSMDGGAWWAAVHGVAAARAETFLIEKTQGSAIGIQWVEAKHAAELLKRD